MMWEVLGDTWEAQCADPPTAASQVDVFTLGFPGNSLLLHLQCICAHGGVPGILLPQHSQCMCPWWGPSS